MRDEDISRYLREAIETSPDVPVVHPERKADCHPVARLMCLAREPWQMSGEDHIAKCSYCQKTLGAFWKLEPPSFGMLARYVLAPESFFCHRAMEIYLEHAGRGRLDRVAGYWTRCREMGATLERLKNEVGAVFVPFGPRAAVLAEGAELPDSTLRFTLVTPFPLELTLRRTPAGQMRIELSAARSEAGKRLRVELNARSGPVACEVALVDDGECAQGSCELGLFDRVAHELGRECLVTVEERKPNA
jgi:hypothetical protein